MISIDKNGQVVDLTKVPELNGKKSFVLDNLNANEKLILKVSKDQSFKSELVNEDVKIEFKDSKGEIFEIVLKNLSQMLATNDGDTLVEIIQEDSDKVLASIFDLNSALEASAAGVVISTTQTTNLESETLSLNNESYENAPLNENQQTNDPLVLAQADIPNTSRVINTTLEGSSIDGYISGMTVFSDANGDGDFDAGEATGTTDDIGVFSLSGDLSGYTIGTGGTDISTGATFEGLYKAPSGVSILNPVTTLISNLMQIEGLNQDDAEAEVRAAFGIDSAFSLTTDPIQASLDTNDGYVSVQLINTIIENTIAQIASALKAKGETELDAYIAASEQLAIAVHDGLDFTADDLDLTSLIEATLTSLEYAVDALPVADLLEVISNTNTALEESIEGDGSVIEKLTNIVKTQKVTESIEDAVESEITSGSTTLTTTKESSNVETIKEVAKDVYVSNVTIEQVANEAPTIDNLLTEVTMSENALDDIFADDYSYSGTLSTASDLNGDVLIYEYANNLVLTVASSNETLLGMINETNGIPLSVLKADLVDFVSNLGVFATVELSAKLTEFTEFVNDATSASEIKAALIALPYFTLDVNSVSVTLPVSDVKATELASQGLLNITVSSTGEYTVASPLFNSLADYESANVTFNYVVSDTIEDSQEATVSLTVTGNNDAPVITIVNPLDSVSENALQTMFSDEKMYFVLSEADVLANLTIEDADLTNWHSLTLASDVTFAGTPAGDLSFAGIIQLDDDFIAQYGIDANEGDFMIYNEDFALLSQDELMNINFQIVANDGSEDSAAVTVSLNVVGTNEAPTIDNLLTEVTMSENALDDIFADDYSYSGTLSTASDLNGDVLIYEYANNLVLTVASSNETLLGMINETNGIPLSVLKADLVDFVSNLGVFATVELSAKLTEFTEFVNDATSASEIKAALIALPYFTLDVNSVSVTLPVSDVKATELASQGLLNITVSSTGEYTVASPLFNSLADYESANVTFNYVVSDTIEDSQEATVSLTVTGNNDAPVITIVNPLDSVSENALQTMFSDEKMYFVLSEADVLANLTIEDADLTNWHSLTLASDVTFAGTPAGDLSFAGIIQLDDDFIAQYGIDANEGDFMIYNEDFALLSQDELMNINFQIVANDGSEDSAAVTVSLNVVGTNEAPTIDNLLTEVTMSENALDDIFADDYSYSGTLSTASDLNGDVLIYEYANNLVLTVASSNETLLGMINETNGIPLSVLKADLVDFVSNLGVFATVELSAKLTEFTEFVNDATSASEIKAALIALPYFTLDVNSVSVTLPVSDVKATELASQGLLNITVSSTGEYTVASPLFNSLADYESANVTFNYVVSDTIEDSQEATVSLTVTGNNDAPVITIVNPLDSVSENALQTMFSDEKMYFVLSEADVLANLTIEDADLTNWHSLTLASDVTFAGTPAGDLSFAGIIQLDDDFIAQYGIDANEGDFMIYNEDFALLSQDELMNINFQIVANDGSEDSAAVTVSLNVVGTNEAPTIDNLLTEVTMSENALDDIFADDYSYSGTLSTASDLNGDVLIYEYANNLVLTVASSNETLLGMINETNGIPLSVLKADLVDFVSNLGVFATVELSAKLTEFTEFVNDATSASEIKAALIALPYFTLDVNSVSVTLPVSDVKATELASQGLLNITVSSTGEYTVASPLFNSLADYESANVTFNYVVSDTIEDSQEATVSLTVTGNNDAPVITIVNPLDSVSENALQTMFSDEKMYFVLSEADVLANLTIEDADLTNWHSLTLASDVTFAGTPAGDLSFAGIIQLDDDFIAQYGIDANEGDFMIYNEDFALLSENDDVAISFQVTVNDGTTNSDVLTVSLDVNGTDFEIQDDALSIENNGGTYDLSEILAAVGDTEINSIDLSASGEHILSGLDLEDFFTLTDENNTLIIDRLGSDSVTLDSNWNFSESNKNVDGKLYTEYTADYYPAPQSDKVTLTLLIEQDPVA